MTDTNLTDDDSCGYCDRMEKELKRLSERMKAKEVELHAAHARIEELTAENLALLNKHNDLWDKVNNPKMKV